MEHLKLSMSPPMDFVSGTWILDSNRYWDYWVTDHSPSFRARVFFVYTMFRL